MILFRMPQRYRTLVWLPCSVNHMGDSSNLRSYRFVNGVGHLQNDLRIKQNGSSDYKCLDDCK